MTFNDKKHCHKIVIYDITLFYCVLCIYLMTFVFFLSTVRVDSQE